MFKRLTIVGSGSWATALVKVFSDSGVKVTWLVRDQQTAESVIADSRNPRYLRSAALNMECVFPVSDVVEACADTEMLVFAVPSAYLKDSVKRFEKELPGKISLAVSIKGFVPGTGLTPSKYISTYFGRAYMDVTVIGGPCHAEEIAAHKSTYVTIASGNAGLVEALRASISCDYIHTIASPDPSGIEYASILKNIIGIASGISTGLLYGDNFQSVLVANSMREAVDIIGAVQPGERDFFKSAYFGDLLVTAYSEYSRNRTLGKLVGRGIDVNKAIRVMNMVAEGFHASKELATVLKGVKIEAPVISAVHRILHKHANAFNEFKLLEGKFN